jgi:hypothetical protein
VRPRVQIPGPRPISEYELQFAIVVNVITLLYPCSRRVSRGELVRSLVLEIEAPILLNRELQVCYVGFFLHGKGEFLQPCLSESGE